MGLNNQLKSARLRQGYTQQQVADIIGVSKSTYCGYETGKRQPDVSKIKMLAKILKVSGDELLETGFEKTGRPLSPYYLDEFVKQLQLSDRDREVLELYLSLNTENREAVLKYIKFIASQQNL